MYSFVAKLGSVIAFILTRAIFFIFRSIEFSGPGMVNIDSLRTCFSAPLMLIWKFKASSTSSLLTTPAKTLIATPLRKFRNFSHLALSPLKLVLLSREACACLRHNCLVRILFDEV